MNNILRRQKIVQLLKEYRSLETNRLAQELNVSIMTIRRDLNQMAAENLITLTHGGAIYRASSMYELSIQEKSVQKKEEKKRIGREAALEIHDGESIFLDAGTTVPEIIDHLGDKKNLVVFTNSLLAANLLRGFSDIKTIMCPGEYRESSFAYMGPLTNNFISHFEIDVLFLGIEGIHPEAGLTVPDITDGLTKQALISSAKHVICLADSSKFDTSYLYRVAPLSQADRIITDEGLSSAVADIYMQKGVMLSIV